MNFFARTQRLVSTTLHSWLDRLESPEQSVRQSLREFEAAIDHSTAAVARAVAAERWLIMRRDEARQRLQSAERLVQAAIDGGNESDAKNALRAEFDLRATLDHLDRQVRDAASHNESLRSQLRRMHERYREAKHAAEQQSIRRMFAEARVQASAAERTTLDGAVVGRFEAELDGMTKATLEREAIAELNGEPGRTERTLENIERETFVEHEWIQRRKARPA